MGQESIVQKSNTSNNYQEQLVSIAGLLETQAQLHRETKNTGQVDSVAQSSNISPLETARRHRLDPVDTLPIPKTPTSSTPNRPYTIWQAIGAVSELFQPQAIANADILAVLNKVSGLTEKNINQMTKYQSAVTSIQNHIRHLTTTEHSFSWGMAGMGLVFGALMGLAMGGPVGLICALAVGTASILLSNQINVNGQPLGNWLVSKMSGGKIHTGDTSAFGAYSKMMYKNCLEMGLPKGKVGREIIEGLTQISLGIGVALISGSLISSYTNSAMALEDADDSVVNAVKRNEEDEIPVNDPDSDTESDGIENNKTTNQSEISTKNTEEELETRDEEVEELEQEARQAQQEQNQDAEIKGVDRRNPGGVKQITGQPRKRGFVLGLTYGNQIANANTKDGNAYSDLLLAAGVSQNVSDWVGMGIGELVSVATGIGSLFVGGAPGATNQFIMGAVEKVAFLQPIMTLLTSLADGSCSFQLWDLYTNRLKPQKENLDNAEKQIQTVQIGEKAALGMASTTTNMVTQEMETAVAMLNNARTVVQSIFGA